MTSHLVVLEREADTYVAAEQAALLAGDVGFDRYACGDIETAVSELCTNALRHADGGWAAIRRLPDRFEVSVTDRGPGFGGPRRGSTGLGIGLEGARRLMGSLEIGATAGGSRVTAYRPLPASSARHRPSPIWSVEAAFRTRSGQSFCGDVMRTIAVAEGTWVAVADGLGSGLHASLAARRALDGLDLSAAHSPADALLAAHHSSGETRGAAVAVVRLDDSGGGLHASLGDVSCAIVGRGELVGRPGIVGYGRPRPEDTPFELAAGEILLMWTDGLGRLPLEDSHIPHGPAALEAIEQMALDLGTPHDDGALVAVRRRT